MAEVSAMDAMVQQPESRKRRDESWSSRKTRIVSLAIVTREVFVGVDDEDEVLLVLEEVEEVEEVDEVEEVMAMGEE